MADEVALIMLVLNANILIRAVLGSRVLNLLRKYAETVEFLAPDVAFNEAREHLPEILKRRSVMVDPAMAALAHVGAVVLRVDRETYLPFEAVARKRRARRDVHVATARPKKSVYLLIELSFIWRDSLSARGKAQDT